MKKLIEIQSALKAPKSQFNSFGKYKYRNCEDILEALKPLLHQHNCLLTITDSVKEIAGSRYIEATVTFVDLESQTSENNEPLSVSVSASAGFELERKGMDLSQIFGSASSYARKYALSGLLLIDDTKDADATNDHGKAPTKPSQAKSIYKYNVTELAKRQDIADWLHVNGLEVDSVTLPDGSELKQLVSSVEITKLKNYEMK